ncbi:transmembrane protein 221 isoform X1 [Hemicordylus capensis]|uniref:transmembrane protein 221 isoform X1 n=1 Tax=Hemicordylus capensis TaxID=884348 RepID=UPI0023034503|nr:transmembrane protein 221 isoform X1 [Hemicordylus capensis]
MPPSSYGQRALGALLLFGTVSGLMAVLASMLIFQIQAGRRAGPGAGGGGLPEGASRVLLPLSAVLASLCLVLSLSCLLLSLLHGYCGAERCASPGGALGPDSPLHVHAGALRDRDRHHQRLCLVFWHCRLVHHGDPRSCPGGPSLAAGPSRALPHPLRKRLGPGWGDARRPPQQLQERGGAQAAPGDPPRVLVSAVCRAEVPPDLSGQQQCDFFGECRTLARKGELQCAQDASDPFGRIGPSAGARETLERGDTRNEERPLPQAGRFRERFHSCVKLCGSKTSLAQSPASKSGQPSLTAFGIGW